MVFKNGTKIKKKKKNYLSFLNLFISFINNLFMFLNLLVFNFNIYIDKEYDFHIPFFMQKI
ncbi:MULTISPECIES: hypothetical protein [Cetobacterium]|jgi:hypothetical protein|uniref:Uncharacterized protein n=1 Tax=Cetobacterium somerae ATCC BAA-474 TaxID=1319815 RepID=U7VD59_9FUSO|nr:MULTISPECIES: hypothetical protein [Cetobacterium]ERT69480.1 hypothetical protein HMPREF0202_00632 [Cetobacterium somerae ATCC BAA-474]MBC2853107.1 hypothetical protein [Cetobacterium sp. 2G large]MCQ8211525.1 hypothetical protein [Cetobacterium sp. NK01]MCQ9625447.1 hypothetical protein [Cetobacterium somerae]WVJ01280.1 hypothetical protein VSU16_00775 [Cetobacterium somerae]